MSSQMDACSVYPTCHALHENDPQPPRTSKKGRGCAIEPDGPTPAACTPRDTPCMRVVHLGRSTCHAMSGRGDYTRPASIQFKTLGPPLPSKKGTPYKVCLKNSSGQGQNLVLTAVCVPSLLNSGRRKFAQQRSLDIGAALSSQMDACSVYPTFHALHHFRLSRPLSVIKSEEVCDYNLIWKTG